MSLSGIGGYIVPTVRRNEYIAATKLPIDENLESSEKLLILSPDDERNCELTTICEVNVMPGITSIEYIPSHANIPEFVACGYGDGSLNMIDYEDISNHPSIEGMFACSAGCEIHIIKPSSGEIDSIDTSHTGIREVSWNAKVPNIIGSNTDKGLTSIWDLKTKKEVICLRDPSGRSVTCGFDWKQDVPTQLAIGFDDEKPVVQLWDLRYATLPVVELPTSSMYKPKAVNWNKRNHNILTVAYESGIVGLWDFANTDKPKLVNSFSGRFESIQSTEADIICSSNSTFRVDNIQRYLPSNITPTGFTSFGFGGVCYSSVGDTTSLALTHTNEKIGPNSVSASVSDTEYPEYLVKRSDGDESAVWNLISGLQENTNDKNLRSILYPKIIPEKSQPTATTITTAESLSTASNNDETHSDWANVFDTISAQTTEKPHVNLATDDMQILRPEEHDWESATGKQTKLSLLSGSIPDAVDCLMRNAAYADALIIASGGGTALFEQTRDRYIALCEDKFLGLMHYVLRNDFDGLVNDASYENWRDVVSLLHTYVENDEKKLRNYLNLLGAKLTTENCSEKQTLDAAIFCFICANNFDAVIQTWTDKNECDIERKIGILQKIFSRNSKIQSNLASKYITRKCEKLSNLGQMNQVEPLIDLIRGTAANNLFLDKMEKHFGKTTSKKVTINLNRPAPTKTQATGRFGNQPTKQMNFPKSSLHSGQASHHPPQTSHVAAPPPQTNTFQSMNPPSHGAVRPPPNVPHAPIQHNLPPGQHHIPPPQTNKQTPPPMSNPMSNHFSTTAYTRSESSSSINTPKVPGTVRPPPPPGGGVAPPKPHTPPPTRTSVSSTPGTNPPPHGGPPPQNIPQNSTQPPPPARTAPTVSGKPVTTGLPVSWPIPTKEQQRSGPVNNATAPHNTVCHSEETTSNGHGQHIIDQGSIDNIQGKLGQVLQVKNDILQGRRREDVCKRFDHLMTMLNSQKISTEQVSMIIEVLDGILGNDLPRANEIYGKLAEMGWENHKVWLMGIKRVM